MSFFFSPSAQNLATNGGFVLALHSRLHVEPHIGGFVYGRAVIFQGDGHLGRPPPAALLVETYQGHPDVESGRLVDAMLNAIDCRLRRRQPLLFLEGSGDSGVIQPGPI